MALTAGLLCPLPAHAMIAVSLFRPPLRHAAEVSAQCPDIRDGRYVVRLRIEGNGRARDVELQQAPEGITLLTEACIERAFAIEPYPSAGSRDRPVDSIQVSFPFVVAGHVTPTLSTARPKGAGRGLSARDGAPRSRERATGDPRANGLAVFG